MSFSFKLCTHDKPTLLNSHLITIILQLNREGEEFMMIKVRWVIVFMIVLSINSFAEGKAFANLNFSVSIDYSSQALQKLQKSHEKVEVWVIIDQYGKQYMEEEAVAEGEIIINPGEKAVFHGLSSTDSPYHYNPNKRYMLTISIMSARKIYENNILDCYSKSGKIDYNIHEIQGKELVFQCKLIR